MPKRLVRIGIYLSVPLFFYFWYVALFMVDWFDKYDRFNPTLNSQRYLWEYYEENPISATK